MIAIRVVIEKNLKSGVGRCYPKQGQNAPWIY